MFDDRVAHPGEVSDVVVTVRNGGTPIPEAQIPGLFEAFKKGHDNPAGLGLGLFIVREIAHAHRGSVAVTSSGEGTIFTFRLPRHEGGDDGSSARSAPLLEGIATMTPDDGEQVQQ